eukprot:gene19382-biopygen23484
MRTLWLGMLHVASQISFKIIVSLRTCVGCGRYVSSAALFACSSPVAAVSFVTGPPSKCLATHWTLVTEATTL